tara:strand:- start:270 stop:506 length:237 start_codon:yes stop_codon:yes gene_type:complete
VQEENIITLDGEKIKNEDLSQEQQYLKRQVIDLRNKKSRLQFDLDQILVTLQSFEQILLDSFKESAGEVLSDESEVVK